MTTNAYISPHWLAKIEGATRKDLKEEPVLTCPRCRFSLLKVDLIEAELITERRVDSPSGAIKVAVRFWPCISCGATLYGSQVDFADGSKTSSKQRIESAIEGFYSQIQLENRRWDLALFLQMIRDLLSGIEEQRQP